MTKAAFGRVRGYFAAEYGTSVAAVTHIAIKACRESLAAGGYDV